MDRSRGDAGFTLIELLVVAGMIVVIVATLGVFFLAGPSPAVAAAGRDIGAAFAEARQTATSFDEATVVFAPAGTGYAARVYRAMPGASEFQPVDGPSYDSTVAVRETAAPLGAPGFAFRIDSRGTVTGYANFTATDTTFTTVACPASGAFVLALVSGNQRTSVTVPCTLSVSAVGAVAFTTPAAAVTPAPYAPGTCPPTAPCGTTPLPAIAATCPAGYTPDATPDVCDSPTPTSGPTSAPSYPIPPTSSPTATPTCPPGETGQPPFCVTSPTTPTPTPTSTADPYSVIATSGGHQVGAEWASWAEVQIYFDGSALLETCYGTGTGPTLKKNGLSMADYTSLASMISDGVPGNDAVAADVACAQYASPNAYDIY